MAEPAKSPPPTNVIGATLDWWCPLVEPTKPGKPGNRGELASLRRCKNLEEVLFVPAYHQLFYRVAALGWSDRISVAALAGLLAHVREDLTQRCNRTGSASPDVDAPERDDRRESPRTVAALLATPVKPGQGPRVSELRFQRLVKIKDLNELYPSLIRVIHLAGERLPVPDLIRSLRRWNDEQRCNWTYRYYDTLLNTKSQAQTQGDAS